MRYQVGVLMYTLSRKTRSRSGYLRVDKIEESLVWIRDASIVMLQEAIMIPTYSQIKEPV
jgi:hypothetical protein